MKGTDSFKRRRGRRVDADHGDGHTGSHPDPPVLLTRKPGPARRGVRRGVSVVQCGRATGPDPARSATTATCLTGAATDVNVAGKSKSAFLASACFSGYWLVGDVLSLAKQNQEKGQLADCYQAAAQSLYPHVSEKAV